MRAAGRQSGGQVRQEGLGRRPQDGPPLPRPSEEGHAIRSHLRSPPVVDHVKLRRKADQCWQGGEELSMQRRELGLLGRRGGVAQIQQQHQQGVQFVPSGGAVEEAVDVRTTTPSRWRSSPVR